MADRTPGAAIRPDAWARVRLHFDCGTPIVSYWPPQVLATGGSAFAATRSCRSETHHRAHPLGRGNFTPAYFS